jgi:hypothetical protein
MGEPSDNEKKWKYTLIATVVFLIIACPYTYSVVHELLKSFVKIVDSNGCPTKAGCIVHAAVFALIIRAIMECKI